MDVLHCSRCGYDIVIPELDKHQKTHLASLCREKKSLVAVKYLLDTCGSTHAQAKAVVTHLTPCENKCHRCNYDTLAAGNIVCPKCKSVNLNW